MTLIEVRNSDGVVGRCDERCHGRNHGAGLPRAIENTRELADSLAAEYRGTNQVLELADRVLGQMPLFSD